MSTVSSMNWDIHVFTSIKSLVLLRKPTFNASFAGLGMEKNIMFFLIPGLRTET